MLTLIRREIEDCPLLYVMTLIFGLGSAGLLSYYYYDANDPWPMTAIPGRVLGMPFRLVLVLMTWGPILDIAQRSIDQKDKTSAFLCTLTPTRGQLLTSKWLAALILLICGLVPMIAAHSFFLYRAGQWGEVQHTDAVVAQLGLMALVPVSCYLLSQFLALGSRLTMSLITGMLILGVVISLIIVKVLLPPTIHQVNVVLGVLSIAAGVGTWSKFHTVSL